MPSPHAHWRVLGSLLYAETPALDRGPDGRVVGDTAEFARVVGLRPHRLRDAVTRLQAAGLVRRVRWYPGAFHLTLTPPTGMGLTTGGTLDV
jgi:hypothetical protein